MRRWLFLVACGCGPTSEPRSRPVEVALATPASAPIATSTPRPPPSNEGLDGEYAEDHEIMVVCEGPNGCHADVTDTLRIREKRGQLEIAVELVQTNGHLCSWEGSLEARGNGEWTSFADDCSVFLNVTDETIVLRSDGCREYCGARAMLDAEFSRAARRPPASRP